MRKFFIEGQDVMDLFYNREDVYRVSVCEHQPYATEKENLKDSEWYQVVEFGYTAIAVRDGWGYSAKPIKYEDVTMVKVNSSEGKYVLVRNRENPPFVWLRLLEHYAWYVDEEESAGNIPLKYREWLNEYGQIIIEKYL